MIYRILLSLLILTIFQIQVFADDFVSKKLESGQLVLVKEVRDNPIVTINTWIRTGSINEDDTNSGVAHFLEHLFFKGSKNVPSGEFDKILESKGAITNAATSKDFTQYYITIPSNEFDLALKLHSDMLLNPLVPRKELEKERLVVLEEISRGLDNPVNVVYNNLFKVIYNQSKHPYFRPVIGSKDIISTISREQILDFYNKWYTPNNMITVVSGDVDSKYAISEIEKAFKTDVKTQNKISYPNISPIKGEIKISEEKDVAQGYMAIGFSAPKFVDSKDTYALDLLAVILGGSNSSILNVELKEKKQLVNSISTSYSQYLDDGLFIISSTYKPEKFSAVKKEIFDEIQKVKDGNITKEQLQKAKNMIKSSTAYSRESASNIANELGFFAFYFNSPNAYNDYLKKIDNIKLKDVIKVAKKYLSSSDYAISTVMPKGFVEVSDVVNKAAAVKIFPDSGKIVEQTDKVTKYLLDNGATLIVRNNSHNAIVAIDIYAKGGTFIEDKIGAAFLASANAKRGTRKYSYEELNSYLDENGIKLSLSSRPDMFNISLLTTKDKVKESLLVLDEIVNYPEFSKIEIDKTIKQYKEYVNSLKDRPLAYAMDEFQFLAYENYPYSRNNQVTLKNIDSINRDDIISYYNSILDAKNLVISVTGDVDDSKLIKSFNHIFEDKTKNKIEVKNYLKEQYIPSENVVKRLSNFGKETSWILLSYKTSNMYNLKEVATLRVINSLLGSGMSSRLFKSLRENQGLAYQVGSQIDQNANDGAIVAYIGTNSKNEEVALDGILFEFNKLKTEFVSNKELNEAKDKLLGNMIIALETNMDRAEFMGRYSVYGYDLNILENLKNEIKNVTSSDILTFANKYFSNPYIAVIVGK